METDSSALRVEMTRANSNRAEPEEVIPTTEQELGRLNRILQTLCQCNHALIHATNENQLFQAVCQILVEVGGLRLAWVGQCENDAEKTVRPVAKAGYGVEYVENARISWGEETDRGRGPTGVALRTGKPYWVKDTRTDPCFAPWRSDAISRGYASCVTLPLIADGKRLGNLSLYAGEPNAFNEDTINQYTDLANNLAYGVTALRTREERSRTEEALRESEQRLQDVVDNTTAVIFAKDLDLRYILVNREYERRHGVSRDKLRGKTDFFLHPREVAEAVQENDRHVIEAGVPVHFEESVPSVDGERYYISSRFLLRDHKGSPYAICGIATDITGLKRAEALQFRRARQAALNAGIQLAFSEAAERDLPMVLKACAEVVVRHFDTAIARVWTLDEQESVLALQATAGKCTHPDDSDARIPVGKFNVGIIAKERAAQLTNDLQSDAHNTNPEWTRKEGIRAFAGYPMIVGGRLIGVVGLFARKGLEPDALETLASVAETIAQGITQKVASQKIRENAARLARANELLRRSLDALARDQRLQSFVDQVLMVLTEQLGGYSSTLWLIDVQERKAHLHSVFEDGRVVSAEDSDHPNARKPREWASDDPSWVTLQMKRPFFLSDPIHDPELGYTPAQRARFVALDIRALLLIPLVFGDQLNGVLSVRIAGNRQVDGSDLEFAQSLAQQATLALEMARLAESAKQTALAIERENAARERAAELAKANEALRGCLDSLASVPELDEFLGQVMAAMTRQLGAASSVLRLRNFERNVLTLDLVYQDGRVMTPAEAKYPEKLRTVPLDERQNNLLKQPATVIHFLNDISPVPEAFRSYLLGLGVKTSLVIPLLLARELVGSLTFRFTEDREFRPEELEIARALASQASLAIQLTRLANVARQSAVLAERNELAGEIHDSLAQLFAGISMQLGAAKKVITRGTESGLRYVERGIELAQFGLAEARRTAFSLQPSFIEESGLVAALQKMVERSNIPGSLQCNFYSTGVPEESLPQSVQQNLLRIAQEAMSNAVRHAKPTLISVSLLRDSANLVLEVTDNGFGIANTEAAFKEGFGLSNMHARAEQVGAKIDVRTSAGRGTSIVIRLPLAT